MEQEYIQLTEHVFYLSRGENDRPNIGLIKGGKSFLVIDSGNSKSNMDLFLDKSGLREKENGKILLTHHHWDHVCGAYYSSFPLVSGSTTAAKIKAQAASFRDRRGIEQAEKSKLIPFFTAQNMKNELSLNGNRPLSFRIPDEEIPDNRKCIYDCGGIHAEYFPVKSSHAKGQHAVYVPEEKVLFIGDVLWPDMEKTEEFWHYSLSEFKEMHQTLLSYDAELFIESHAAPLSREILEKWLIRMEKLMKIILSTGLSPEKAENLLPGELKDVRLGYEEFLTTALLNVVE